MKKIIGFANKMFTLWNYDTVKNYREVNGNHILSSAYTKYYYIKNISIDIETVKSLYPNVEIDMSLKGVGNFDRNDDYTDTDDFYTATADVMTFGKYNGQNITDINDLDYLLWLVDNDSNKYRVENIMKLQLVVEYNTKMEAEKVERLNNITKNLFVSGKQNVLFISNPNRTLEGNVYIDYELNYDLISITLEWKSDMSVFSNYFLNGEVAILYTKINYDSYFIFESNGMFYIYECNEKKFFNNLDDCKKYIEYKHTNISCVVDCKVYPFDKKYFQSKVAVVEKNDVSLYVIFENTKDVNGMYPYTMAEIDGKFKRIKNKEFELDLEVVYTKIYECGGAVQVAFIK